jgi:ATP-dependent RNA helicase DeaD
MKEPNEIRLNEEPSLKTIDQSYLIVHEGEKFKHLCNFIRNRDKKQTIVFAATKQRTQRLANELRQEGFRAITIHGDLSQKQRDIAMYRFKKGNEDILVATDIAARGIDVPAVGHVINYDIPEDPLVYFHRIGRTARAGASGKAISLVSQDRIDDFGRILRQTELPVHKLNEEMGIEVPVIRHRRGRGGYYAYDQTSYTSKGGSTYGYRGYGTRYGRNVKQRDFNRDNRYGIRRERGSPQRY